MRAQFADVAPCTRYILRWPKSIRFIRSICLFTSNAGVVHGEIQSLEEDVRAEPGPPFRWCLVASLHTLVEFSHVSKLLSSFALGAANSFVTGIPLPLSKSRFLQKRCVGLTWVTKGMRCHDAMEASSVSEV